MTWRNYDEQYPASGGLHSEVNRRAYAREAARVEFIVAVDTAITAGDSALMRKLLDRIEAGENYPHCEARLRAALGLTQNQSSDNM